MCPGKTSPVLFAVVWAEISGRNLSVAAFHVSLIDFILNLAGLLLWLNWRTLKFATPIQPRSVSLLSTLKYTGRHPSVRWLYLLALFALLGIRSLFYWHIGSAVNWTATLDFWAFRISLRSDFLDRMALYSWLGFIMFLVSFYLWLLLLSIVNRSVPDSEPWQRLVRLQLGWLELFPAAIKLILPFLAGALLWYLLSYWFGNSGLVPRTYSPQHLWQQAALLGLMSYLVWPYLIAAILLLHLLNSYVYLGNYPFWSFINLTARNLLIPFSWLPLKLGRLDFTPLIAVALLMAATHYGGNALAHLFRQLPY
jgi:uncharacterized protein YggT (Ycf19 family)